MKRRDFVLAALSSAMHLSASGTATQGLVQSLALLGPDWIDIDGRPGGWATARGGDRVVPTETFDRGTGGRLPPAKSQSSTLTDLELKFARGMSTEFYEWATGCLRDSPSSPAILESTRFSGIREVLRQRWTGVYIRSLRIPELDAARHDFVQFQANAFAAASSAPTLIRRIHSRPAPRWRRSDFRFHIEGLTPRQTNVLSIATLDFRRPIATNVLDANHRNSVRQGSPVLPILTLRVADWARRNLIRACNSAGDRRAFLDLTTEHGSPWLRFEFRDLWLRSDSEPSSSLVELRFASAGIRHFHEGA